MDFLGRDPPGKTIGQKTHPGLPTAPFPERRSVAFNTASNKDVPRDQAVSQTPSTISPEYQALNAQLHEESPDFGTSGAIHVDKILEFTAKLRVKTFLDYGCGKGLFKAAMTAKAPQYKVYEYDPAIPGKTRCRDRADVVVCNDVLEHVEPAHVDSVLKHIKSIAEVACVFLIDHLPAAKTLPDGRNAHINLQPYEWWRDKLGEYFYHVTLLTIETLPDGAYGRTLVAVSAKKLKV